MRRVALAVEAQTPAAPSRRGPAAKATREATGWQDLTTLREAAVAREGPEAARSTKTRPATAVRASAILFPLLKSGKPAVDITTSQVLSTASRFVVTFGLCRRWRRRN